MADSPEQGNGSGSNDRATVALVAAEVREVKAIVAGHASTSAAELKGINSRLDGLSGVPAMVADHAARIAALEKAQAWRSGTLPMVMLGVAMFIVAVITLVVSL